MAPSTRLQSKPERRVDYSLTTRAGTRSKPVLLEEPPASDAIVRRESEVPEPTSLATKPVGKSATRVKAGKVNKSKVVKKKPAKAAPKPKKQERPERQECSICATTKSTARSFKVYDSYSACEHFDGICNLCIRKLLQTKIAERQFTNPGLGCPFPKCDHALDFVALKKIMSKAAYEEYDNALLKQLLSADEFYIACLSEECGKYFSIEACKNGKRSKQKIACPYCEYGICLKCNRPWKTHGSGGCDKAKQKEDKQSEEAVKSMGAKPCPSCGVNIEKFGGCDHMTCERCHENFCWQCFVPYSHNMQHHSKCPHARVNVAAEPGNWAADNLNIGQVNNLIRQAQARLDAPPQDPLRPAHMMPAFAPLPPPIPPPNMQAPLTPVAFPVGIFNLYEEVRGNGGGGGGSQDAAP
ncbi:Nn.00g069140.m01.CDS01 [Neocucurbitaria sp. VM-36]